MSALPGIDPIDYVVFSMQAIVAFANIPMIYFLFHKGRKFKWTLPFAILNLLSQILMPISRAILWTSEFNLAVWAIYGASVVLEFQLYCVVIYLNLELLAMFAFLSDSITPKKVLYAKLFVGFEFLVQTLLGILSTMQRWTGTFTAIAKWNTLFVGVILIVHNSWQTWWLLTKVYSYSTRNPDKIERVSEKFYVIRRYMLILAALDWLISPNLGLVLSFQF
jgi:hypothetical protein